MPRPTKTLMPEASSFVNAKSDVQLGQFLFKLVNIELI